MSYPRLASHLYNAPLLITPSKAEVLERVFRAYVDGTSASLPAFTPDPRPQMDLAAAGGAMQTRAGYLRTSDGIAVIQVIGSLVQRGMSMDALSGLQSYDDIQAQLVAAIDDTLVRAILLEIDSAGGEGSGLFDLAEMVDAMDAVKPITAHANEQAFSAAYALAVSAGELYVARTGMVGSVGVMMLHVDQSGSDAKKGLVYTPIFAGAHKDDFSPHAPLSDAAMAEAQVMVYRLYETFVAHVAEMRQIDPQVVRDTEAGLLHPDQAIALGMVDGVATLAEAMDSLRTRADDMASQPNRFHQRAAVAGAPLKEYQMPQDTNKPAATAAAITPEQLADARTAGIAEGEAKAKAAADAAATKLAAEATATATKAERDRIKAITTHAEASDRGKLAAHIAHNTTMSVDEAIAMLAAAPKEVATAANPLAAAMGKVPNPNIGADAGAGDDGEETAQSVAARIVAAGKNIKLKAVK